MVLIGVVTVVGLALRLRSLNSSLFADELSTYYIVSGHSLSRVLQLVHSNQELTPPLYFILVWLTKGVLGNQVESIRLVSLTAGVAAIPLTYVLGLWTVGKRAALVGATGVALSPFMIYYSTEARAYMLMCTLALVSTLGLLKALDTGRWIWWAGYAAASCACIYTHYTVVFVLIAQFIWAFWTRPEARRRLLTANGVVLLAYLPWLGGLRQDLHSPTAVASLNPFDLSTVWTDLWSWSIGHPYITVTTMPGPVALAVAGVGLALAVIGLVTKAGGGRRRRWPSARTVLILALALASVVGTTIQSSIGADVFSPRSLITSWPGLALAIGLLVTSPPRPFRMAAVAMVLGAIAVGSVQMLRSQSQRPDIGAAAQFIEHRGLPGNVIVDTPEFVNPLSDLDVALANSGQPTYVPGNWEDRALPATPAGVVVLRLGLPPLSVGLHSLTGANAQKLGDASTTPPQVVAKQAADLARHGTLYLVATGSDRFQGSFLDITLSAFPNSTISLFLRALPKRFHLVETRTFPSFPFESAVYTFRDTHILAQRH